MVFHTYILQSETSGRFYIGSTGDLEQRIKDHNDPNYTGSKTTKRFRGPWILVYKEPFETRSEAMKREKEIKGWKSRKAIEKLIEFSR